MVKASMKTRWTWLWPRWLCDYNPMCGIAQYVLTVSKVMAKDTWWSACRWLEAMKSSQFGSAFGFLKLLLDISWWLTVSGSKTIISWKSRTCSAPGVRPMGMNWYNLQGRVAWTHEVHRKLEWREEGGKDLAGRIWSVFGWYEMVDSERLKPRKFVAKQVISSLTKSEEGSLSLSDDIARILLIWDGWQRKAEA